MRKITLVTGLIAALLVAFAEVAYARSPSVDSVNKKEEIVYRDRMKDPSWEDELENAVKRWDALNCHYTRCSGVNIRPAAAGESPDLVIKTRDVPNADFYGFWNLNPKRDVLVINTHLADKVGGLKREELMLHEWGHALGFSHESCAQDQGTSVMVTDCWSTLDHPGRDDRIVYQKKWIDEAGDHRRGGAGQH